MATSFDPFSRLRQYFRRRKQTEKLSAAIKKGDMDAMRRALEAGAEPQRVRAEFPEPAMHFPEYYDVRGALELAAHQQLGQEAFALLIQHGARPLSKLAERHANGWPLASTVEAMIEHAELEARTAAAGPGRARGMRL